MRAKTQWYNILIVAVALALVAPAWPQGGGGCPGINAILNFKPSSLVGAEFTLSGTTATYFFDSWVNTSPSNGVPGLIEYCVYPNQPPGNPDGGAVATATGANTDPFKAVFKDIQGYFAFTRGDGDPSNIPLDGRTNYQMGTATWASGAPAVQTILLHINDPVECGALYGTGSGTCFVYPTSGGGPPEEKLCNGDPACKEVVITEACTGTPLTVPAFSLLHIHYTYVIVNQPTNTFNMIFNPPTPKTQDINSGGGKDYFGCEQIPDTSGAPGHAGTIGNYQNTGFNLNMDISPGQSCVQSRFFLTAPSQIILTPDHYVTFTIDMVTRVNKGGKQEYTSLGSHFLNSGFTIKWFQSNDTLMHSYTTNPPIVVNAVASCPAP